MKSVASPSKHRRTPTPPDGPWADLPTYLPGVLQPATTLLDVDLFTCTAPPAYTERWWDWLHPRAVIGLQLHHEPLLEVELGHRAGLAMVDPYELANALLRSHPGACTGCVSS